MEDNMTYDATRTDFDPMHAATKYAGDTIDQSENIQRLKAIADMIMTGANTQHVQDMLIREADSIFGAFPEAYDYWEFNLHPEEMLNVFDLKPGKASA